MSWNTFPIRLLEAALVTPSVLHLVFERGDGEALDYRAGQFVNIHFVVDGQPVHRSYSVAAPPGGGRIEIAMSPVKDGRATSLLQSLRPGDVIEASGPYGRFVLRDDPPCRYVMVATGTGVTPYRAMLPELSRRLGEGFSVELLLGVWRRDELLYGEEFVAFAQRHEGFSFRACYSRALPDDAQPWEHRGYVQQHFGHVAPDPQRDVFYLCGNPNMIDEAVVQLKERGFATRQLRREKYLPSKT